MPRDNKGSSKDRKPAFGIQDTIDKGRKVGEKTASPAVRAIQVEEDERRKREQNRGA